MGKTAPMQSRTLWVLRGANRVSRGCSWHYTIDYCRCPRMSAGAMFWFGHMGFRVARSLPSIAPIRLWSP